MLVLYKTVQGIGLSLHNFFSVWYKISLLCYDAVTSLFDRRSRSHLSFDQLVGQILFTGLDALLIVAIIAVSCGLIISLQTMINMPEIGISEYFGKIMVISIIRELGPLITSLIVIGRSGAALAAYIGNMKVTKEIYALEIMGIDPIHFLVTPAFLGVTFSMLALNVYFDVFAIIGGLLLVSFVVDTSIISLINEVFNAVTFMDILISLGKGLVFGAIIASVSTYHGLVVENIRMVPRAVFHAVVTSLVVTIMLNLIFTFTYYAILY